MCNSSRWGCKDKTNLGVVRAGMEWRLMLSTRRLGFVWEERLRLCFNESLVLKKIRSWIFLCTRHNKSSLNHVFVFFNSLINRKKLSNFIRSCIRFFFFFNLMIIYSSFLFIIFYIILVFLIITYSKKISIAAVNSNYSHGIQGFFIYKPTLQEHVNHEY